MTISPKGDKTMADIGKKRILAALDGSRASMDTVAYLANLLPATGSEVVLFTITTGTPESFWDFEGEPNQELTDLWIKYQKKSLGKFGEEARKIFLEAGFNENDITVKIQDRTKGIARDIITESAKGYDAVVIGRSGMNPITRVVIGSVANKLVENIADKPVCIVGKNLKNRKILVAMDASENAIRCVKYAGEMFGKTDAEFLLFHVIRDYDFKISKYRDTDASDIEESRWLKITQVELQKASQTMNSIMDKAINELENMGITKNRITKKILTGMATRGGSIAAQAMLAGYATIVIGRRGLSKVGEFNMGRVCYKVYQLGNDVAVWVVN
jgi:nucleotide-binding universal stress UspA family protein